MSSVSVLPERIMEQVHGIDVSWMTHHGGPKDRAPIRRATFPAPSEQSPHDSAASSPVKESHDTSGDANTTTDSKANGTGTQPKSVIPPKPGFTRGNSMGDKNSPSGSPGLSRKPSWFSNLSSKFSGAGGQSQSPPQATNSPTKDAELSVPKITPAKNAVLQHAAKHQGEGPYTPAPPKMGQTSLLHVFRRLSSNTGQLSPGLKGGNNHGLVERKILNVDQHRERCPLEDLNQSKLRRVAFCVDVEIAPMPKYGDSDTSTPHVPPAATKTEKHKLVERGEGEALKHPQVAEEQKEQASTANSTGEELPKDSTIHGSSTKDTSSVKEGEAVGENGNGTKKKEKKKRSEEERKARKEKKRKLAEANGQIPLELHRDTDTSDPSVPVAPRPQIAPTTNPVRIYRRCCQLRETPILKKITEQLLSASNTTSAGVVEKLDLTGYWMQLADLVTLGDFLAVVPVRELILENCGLNDEGARVVLAGLLAAKKPSLSPRKRPINTPDGLVEQGGAVERVVLKNNKLGPEGWKYVCLFVYMCRTLTSLDLAEIPFPKPPPQTSTSNGHGPFHHAHHDKKSPLDTCSLFAKSLGERLGGSTLELLNLSDTGLNHSQLGRIIDGILACGVRRLGLARLDLDLEGFEHVRRFLGSGKCEGLDLGGNDLRDHCEKLGDVIEENNALYALSLAECNLKPVSLCKLLPHLAKLSNFRFLDLSHNQELFQSDPSAVGTLRRYLPMIKTLKRIHLSDCALKSDQLIALAEVIPEMDSIAHVSFLQNPELTKLADASTEETQEEASALYASLLAAARLSPHLVAVDIDVPTERNGEVVKALAKQIIAYTLRNMERITLSNGGTALGEVKDPEYPDVLQHLVGHDVMQTDEPEDEEVTPDDDYIVGGTGVVKALACCLDNRGDEASELSGEVNTDPETGMVIPAAGKAKDASKLLLFSARKIRRRLEPALIKAKAVSDRSTEERATYYRLLFMQRNLDGIIQRFEDEFPETREGADSAISVSPPVHALEKVPTRASLSSAEGEREPSPGPSDGEEDMHIIRVGNLSRQSSNLSLSSLALNREEGHALRAGHKFRSEGIITNDQYQLIASTGVDEMEKSPVLIKALNEMLTELDDEELLRLREEKGAVRVFREHRTKINKLFRVADPEYWDRFVESQQKAQANVSVQVGQGATQTKVPEEAIADDSESAVSD